MANTTKASDRPQYCRDATWYPLRAGWEAGWHQPGYYIPNQQFSMPPVLAPGDLLWMDSVLSKLATLSWAWPRYTWCPPQLSTPIMPTKMQRELWARAAEARGQQYRWRVSLDVNHFFPKELSVKTTDEFVAINGKHEEKQDEHGLISRSFTRKYMLPIGVDAQTIRSYLSGDGVLTVEAPLPKTCPRQRTIPVQIERESFVPGAEKKEDPRSPSASERKRETESQDSPSANRQLSPSSPTRQTWKPKDTYTEGGRGHQDSEFSTSVGDIRQGPGSTQEEAHEQFTDLSEAPATPDTLTSEQEESSDVQQEHQQQQQQQAEGDEAAGESGAEGLGEEGSAGEEKFQEQEAVSGQFQECVMPEQEAL